MALPRYRSGPLLPVLGLLFILCSGLTSGQENVAAAVNATTTPAPSEVMAPNSTASPGADPRAAPLPTQQPMVISNSSMETSEKPVTMMPSSTNPSPVVGDQGSQASEEPMKSNATSVMGNQGSQASEAPMMSNATSTVKYVTPQSAVQSNTSSDEPKVASSSSVSSTVSTAEPIVGGAMGMNNSTTTTMMAQSTTPSAMPTAVPGMNDSQSSIAPSKMPPSSTTSSTPSPQVGANVTEESETSPTMMGYNMTSTKQTPQIGIQGSDNTTSMAQSTTVGSDVTPKAGVVDNQESPTPTMMVKPSPVNNNSTGEPQTPPGVIIIQPSDRDMSSTTRKTAPSSPMESSTPTVQPTPVSSQNQTVIAGSGSPPMRVTSTNPPTASNATSRGVGPQGTGPPRPGTGFTRPQTGVQTMLVMNTTAASRTTVGPKIDVKTPDRRAGTTRPTRQVVQTTRFSRAAPVSRVATTMKIGSVSQVGTSAMASVSTAAPRGLTGSTPGHSPKTPFIPGISPKVTPGATTDKASPIPRQTTIGHIPVLNISQGDVSAASAPVTVPIPIRTTSRGVETSRRVETTTARVPISTPRIPSTSTMIISTTRKRTTQRPPTSSTSATPSTSPEMRKDVTYRIRFDGDCRVVLSDTDVRDKFEKQVKKMFTDKVGVPQDNVLLHDISCGSVDVLVTLHEVQQTQVERKLDEITSNPVPLVVTSGGQTHGFLPVSYTTADATSTTAVPPPSPTTKPRGLRSVDMIIIIIVSIVGGLLMIIIIALIVHECRRRSHTKSFDLRGTPRARVNTEDFTLTKMERGPAEYNEYGLVMNHNHQNGNSRTPPVGVATIVETPSQNGGATCNGYHKSGKEGYETELEVGPDSPSMSLMKSMRTPNTEGIENPSFSSEDILDSGTETDRENVSSDKGIDSPDHAPFQVEAIAETDSGRQSDSPIELQHDMDTTPQHSPRSILSDNTSSDNAYEPFELGPFAQQPSELQPLTEAPSQPDPFAESPPEPHLFAEPSSELEPFAKQPLESHAFDEPPAQINPLYESTSQMDAFAEPPPEPPPFTEPPSEPHPFAEPPSSLDPIYEPTSQPDPFAEAPPELAPLSEPPRSPSSEELMMPTEEISYPSGEKEDEGSPMTVDITSPSPANNTFENNTYEMVETKRAGKRESDYFAPSEGATAF